MKIEAPIWLQSSSAWYEPCAQALHWEICEPHALGALMCAQANDFGGEIIPRAAADHKVVAYLFNDYWEDIGTIKSFFEANLALAQQVLRRLQLDNLCMLSRMSAWCIHFMNGVAPVPLLTYLSSQPSA